MASYSRFEDLPIWRVSRELGKILYRTTASEPFCKDYRFVHQIRAAIGSVMDNIAEGFERENNKEFIHFLYIAKGSIGEVRSQIHRAYDVGYIDEQMYSSICNNAIGVSTSISNFINYLKASDLSGSRHLARNQQSGSL